MRFGEIAMMGAPRVIYATTRPLCIPGSRFPSSPLSSFLPPPLPFPLPPSLPPPFLPPLDAGEPKILRAKRNR